MKRDGANTRFAFGKNWKSYATLIGEGEITEAEKALLRLFPVFNCRGGLSSTSVAVPACTRSPPLG